MSGCAGERRIDEPRQHHAVTARLPRSHDVEKSTDDDRQTELLAQASVKNSSIALLAPYDQRGCVVEPKTRSSSSVQTGLGFLP